MRKGVTTLLGLVLAVGALSACDGDPLSKDADKAVFFFTNPSFATMKIDTIGLKVTARVMNRYNAPTGDAVTATPCDSKITVIKDTLRTEFESPERFVVKAVSPGESCLVVAGGGITDTVDFVIGAQAVKILANAALASGGSAPVDVEFRNAAGQAVTGFDITDVSFTSRNPAIVFVDPTTNTISGRAPGSTYVVTTTLPGRGAAVSDSVLVTVSAGPFSGVGPTSLQQGGFSTLTAGAIPFDSDTKVSVNGTDVYMLSNTATTITFVTPRTTGTTANVVVSNLGANQVASQFSVPLSAEAGEPGNDGPAGARTLTLGTPVYGTVHVDNDIDDYFTFTVAGSTPIDVTLNWIAGGNADTNDVDAYVLKSDGATLAGSGCATSAKPEHCTMTLAPGTYYVVVESFTMPSTLTSQPYILTVK